jgi:alpha-1,6-mannosyltransferase
MHVFADVYPVRGVLGLFNAASLIAYAIGVRKAFGTTASWWYLALQASQFHVIYYASRTLPNTFAFGISVYTPVDLSSYLLLIRFISGTFALCLLLPQPRSHSDQLKRTRLAFYLLTLTTIIFRSELALLLASHSLYLLFNASGKGIQAQITLLRRALLPAGFFGAVIGLGLSIPIDTFFWRSPTPLWPELSAFLSNIFPSDPRLGASAWGTSPWYWYFTSALPRLLLNPFAVPLICYTFTTPATSSPSLPLLIPNIGYILLYSILPHKETRFLFPVIPPLTAAAALAASYITHRRHRNTLYRLATYILVLSTAATFLIAHGVLLPLSALSYPGAHALNALHLHATGHHPNNKSTIAVHLDNLALQTGVTRFLQMPPPVRDQARSSLSSPAGNISNTRWIYDKSDDPKSLLDPFFWEKFDYVIMEDPGLAIGAWDVVDKIYGLGRLRVLKPDQERGVTNPNEGLAAAIGKIYGVEMGIGYCVFKNMVREGYGLSLLSGMRGNDDRGWSLTGGWWVDVEWAEKLFVLRRAGG